MAKGQIYKKELMDKVLELFPNSFLNDKEIRICGKENGEDIQVKLTFTVAKDNISPDGAPVSIKEVADNNELNFSFKNDEKIQPSIEYSQAEKQTLADLLKML